MSSLVNLFAVCAVLVIVWCWIEMFTASLKRTIDLFLSAPASPVSARHIAAQLNIVRDQNNGETVEAVAEPGTSSIQTPEQDPGEPLSPSPSHLLHPTAEEIEGDGAGRPLSLDPEQTLSVVCLREGSERTPAL